MADLFDTLTKEKGSETKQIKIIQHSEDYSESYKNVVFERYALRENNKKNNIKCTFNFQDSLDGLIKRGYSRHPRPNEVFSLLSSYLEGDSSLKCVAEDMLSDYGEWLSLAMKHQNNLLHCYIDPIFEIVDNRYNLKNCFSEKIFVLPSDKRFFKIKEVNALNSSLVEFLWSRSFDKLPLEISNNAYLYLPNDERIWPAGRGGYSYGYSVNCYNCSNGASRGIRCV